MNIINIDVNKMSEKEISNIIKNLLSQRYNEARRIDIVFIYNTGHGSRTLVHAEKKRGIINGHIS